MFALVGAGSCGAPSTTDGLVGAWQGPSSSGLTTNCATRFDGTRTFRFDADGSFAGDESGTCTDPASGCQRHSTGTGTWTTRAADAGVAFVTIMVSGSTVYSGCVNAAENRTVTDPAGTARYRYTVVGSALSLTPVDDRDMAVGPVLALVRR
jgi:hypothetical protein